MTDTSQHIENVSHNLLKDLSNSQMNTLISKLKQTQKSQTQPMFESRNHTSPELERSTMHKNTMIVQYASAFEARKAIYMAKLESPLRLETMLLNDMQLYHLDQDFITQKLKQISNQQDTGRQAEEKLTLKLRNDLNLLRRKQYLNKFIGEDGGYADKNVRVARYQTSENQEDLELNQSGVSERISILSRNRIRDRDEIRKEIKAMFDDLGQLRINREDEFTFNLAGLETVPEKMAERGRKLRGFKGDSENEVIDFHAELKLLKTRRQNYLDDLEGGADEKRQQLRGRMQKAQIRLTKFQYEDVRAEMDDVLSEFGLDEKQRCAFEEMMILNKDLGMLLDGTDKGAKGAFDRLVDSQQNPDTIHQISRTKMSFNEQKLAKGDRIMRRVDRKFSVTSRKDMELRNLQIDRRNQTKIRDEIKDRILHDRLRATRNDDSKQAERHQILFERELDLIYRGEILESPEIQTYIQQTTNKETRDPYNRINQLGHVLDIHSKPFINQEDENEILADVYGQTEILYKKRDIIREEERFRIEREQHFDNSNRATKLESRVRDFKLQEGVLEDMFKIKPEVAVSQEQIDELVEALNFSDPERRYISKSDDAGEVFLLTYSTGFRFNIPKLLRFRAERQAAAEMMCARYGLDLLDFLRHERGLQCSSTARRDLVISKIINNPEFKDAEQAFIEEYYSNEEWDRLSSLSSEIIESQISRYQEHMAFGKKFNEVKKEDIVLVKAKRKLKTDLSGALPKLDVDLMVD